MNLFNVEAKFAYILINSIFNFGIVRQNGYMIFRLLSFLNGPYFDDLFMGPHPLKFKCVLIDP